MRGASLYEVKLRDAVAECISIPPDCIIKVIKDSPIGIFAGKLEQVHAAHVFNDFAG